MAERPLVVDLDGTLVMTDLLYESSFRLLRQNPGQIPGALRNLLAGRAQFKRWLAGFGAVDPGTLPYNEELVSWLQAQQRSGRRLVLCTAADENTAAPIAAYLGIFAEVLASNGETNLKGANKAAALVERYGRGEYDYVGDSTADLPVWAEAGEAIVVDGSGALAQRVERQLKPEKMRVIGRPVAGVVDWLRLLRVQQWLKNLLIFAPFLAAHRWQEPGSWLALLAAFVAFGLCASATYLFNDLLDIESDRLHPRKCRRALACGQIPIAAACVALPALLTAGILIATLVGGYFLLSLLVYLFLTLSYSILLKRVILLDCLTLAVLYTLRIIAGAAALHMALSFWLLAFSAFLFLSLAFVKRYAEMEVQQQAGREVLHGRGYAIADLPLVRTLGVSAAYLAVLVLALYLDSEEVVLLYATPEIVWGAVLVLLYWVSWIWLQAHRGNMHDDPLVFAIKDKASLVAGGVFLCVVYLGTVDWPW